MLTNYIGELVQHDTSHHVWAPLSGEKWYLITRIDDHSRRILYGDLWEKESSWAHIQAAQEVAVTFGKALRYYVDNHSIFRFIEKRDSFFYKNTATEETATVQWKEVLNELDIEVVYALSPAAKGKVERPYRWLQDHLVRTCLHEQMTHIDDARQILYEEIYQYNYKRIHSVTGEIPVMRYEKCLEENRSLFRTFNIMQPYQILGDIFCYRIKRTVNPYRKISLGKLAFKVHGAPLHAQVELRISFNIKASLANIRIWYSGNLLEEYKANIQDLKKCTFNL